MVAVLLIAFFALLIFGTPIITALMGSSLLSFAMYSTKDLKAVAQAMFASNGSFSLLAIPLFVLAGALMSSGGISKRLIKFFDKLVGWMPGGMAIVAVLACAFFGALSGSAPATVAAIGGIMIPAMVEKDYDTPWTTCLLASSGSLGAIIPPSIPMVLYGVLAKTSVSALFCGGIIPGLLIALGYCLYARGFSKKFKMITSPKPTGKELWKAFVDAIWALLMPVIILGGIYGGYFTPTEAAAVAVVYGLIIGLFVYRELKWKDIPKTFVNAARTSAAVMMIIVTAATFAIVLTRNNIPTLIGNWIIGIAKTPLMFYGLFSIFMFFLGMFMSVSPALVILTPILAPAATAIGIDPVHFGVVFVVWMCIGTITPPFGSDLFIACGVAKISAASAFKRIWPFVIIYVAVVVLIMALPDLVTFLPKLLKLM